METKENWISYKKKETILFWVLISIEILFISVVLILMYNGQKIHVGDFDIPPVWIFNNIF